MRSAVEYHRLYIPFKNIPDVIFCDNIEAITAEYIKDNNITQVWFNRNIAPTTLDPNPLFHLFRRLGVKIICDLDDYWNVGFGHVLYDYMRLSNLTKSSISQIKSSDYVCVTHDYLRNIIIKELNISPHRIIIAPNAIDPLEKQYKQDFEYNIDRLFWQGSVTHHHDLKQMSQALNEMEVKLFIAGYDPSSQIKDKQGKIIYNWDVTGNLFNKKQWIPFMDVENYMTAYDGKGICLIPLEKTKFTQCKSNLKMLEAGWTKKPVIATGIHPYTSIGVDGDNCLFAFTTKAWKMSIKKLLENPNFADDIRFNLHDDVCDNYLIDRVNQTRIDLINKIK